MIIGQNQEPLLGLKLYIFNLNVIKKLLGEGRNKKKLKRVMMKMSLIS